MADDGSSVADCWATGQVATELLGFPSLFEKTQAQLQILTSRIFPVLKQGSEMEASLGPSSMHVGALSWAYYCGN
jgi:hypothetical protein